MFKATILLLQAEIRRVFPLRQQTFSPGGLPAEEVIKKKCCDNNTGYEVCGHVENSLPYNQTSHLLPKYFFCWIRYLAEEV